MLRLWRISVNLDSMHIGLKEGRGITTIMLVGKRKTLTPFIGIARRVKYAVNGTVGILVENRIGKAAHQSSPIFLVDGGMHLGRAADRGKTGLDGTQKFLSQAGSRTLVLLEGIVGRQAVDQWLGVDRTLPRSLKQLYRIAVRVFQEDLLTSRAYENLVAKTHTVAFHLRDTRNEILNLYDEAIPPTGFGTAPVWHGASRRALRSSEPKDQVVP